jgi:hypothetical protein
VLVVAVHAQPVAEATEMVPVSLPEGWEREVGLIVYEQLCAPDWVRVNVRPPTVMWPVRCEVLVLAAAA